MKQPPPPKKLNSENSNDLFCFTFSFGFLRSFLRQFNVFTLCARHAVAWVPNTSISDK